MKTDIYPTRYAAFDNPGNLVEFAPNPVGLFRHCREDAAPEPVAGLSFWSGGGGEVAVYWTEALYVEIRGRLDRNPEAPPRGRAGFVVEIHRDHCRKTLNVHDIDRAFDLARLAIEGT